MSLSEMQTTVKASIWQAIARSGVNLSALSQDEINRLVAAISETVLKDMDEFMNQASGETLAPSAPVVEDAGVEAVLWQGRPFLSIGVHYIITNQRVRVIEGVLGKSRNDVELVRIQDMDYTQGLTERALGIGDITIRSQDRSHPVLVLNNVRNPGEVHEILRQAVLKARKEHGLTFREEM
jgi:hypothetical protein